MILSAADVEVLLGRFNLLDKSEPTGIHRKVREVHIHPDYRTYDVKFDADIAILTLNEPVKFTQHIQPACLPNDPKVEELCDGEVVALKLYNYFSFLKLLKYFSKCRLAGASLKMES